VNSATDRSLTIALEPEQTPITGTVTVVGQADRLFHGWLGLLTALDAAIANLEKTNLPRGLAPHRGDAVEPGQEARSITPPAGLCCKGSPLSGSEATAPAAIDMLVDTFQRHGIKPHVDPQGQAAAAVHATPDTACQQTVRAESATESILNPMETESHHLPDRDLACDD
jgi:hypothetical protein